MWGVPRVPRSRRFQSMEGSRSQTSRTAPPIVPFGQMSPAGLCIIHDFTACGIDQNGRGRHVRQFIGSDQMKRGVGSVVRQWDVQGNEVGLQGFSQWPVSSDPRLPAPMADHAGAHAGPVRVPWQP